MPPVISHFLQFLSEFDPNCHNFLYFLLHIGASGISKLQVTPSSPVLYLHLSEIISCFIFVPSKKKNVKNSNRRQQTDLLRLYKNIRTALNPFKHTVFMSSQIFLQVMHKEALLCLEACVLLMRPESLPQPADAVKVTPLSSVIV